MKRTAIATTLTLFAATLTACGSSESAGEKVIIGTANFPESEIIGQIWAESLRNNGFEVEVSSGIGSREVYLGALQEGSIDVVPEYSGNLAQFYGELPEKANEADVQSTLDQVLPDDLEAGAFSPAESKDAYRVTRSLADEKGLTSIGDLDKLDSITIAGPPEFAERPVGPKGLTSVYGIDANKITMNPIADGGGPLTVKALVDGNADAANIFTTSPALLSDGEEADLVILDDPENLIPPQNVLPVFKSDSLPDGALDVINEIDAKMTTEDLVQMNMRNVGQEHAEPSTIAKDYVDAHK